MFSVKICHWNNQGPFPCLGGLFGNIVKNKFTKSYVIQRIDTNNLQQCELNSAFEYKNKYFTLLFTSPYIFKYFCQKYIHCKSASCKTGCIPNNRSFQCSEFWQQIKEVSNFEQIWLLNYWYNDCFGFEQGQIKQK